MSATDKLFTGSIPEAYDRFLVPLIFEPYARDLAERLADVKPPDLLETAAGTGVLTRAITSRLASGTRLVATDLNQPMLDLGPRDSPVTVRSHGGRPTRLHCHSKIRHLTSWHVSSA